MSKRKFYDNRIQKLKDIMAEAGAKISVANDNGPTISIEEYVNSYRTSMNMILIELGLGGEFTEGKKGYQMKFNHKMMNRAELAEVTSLLDRYITGIEIHAINHWVASSAPAEDDPAADMGIPESRPAGVTVLDKVTKKSLMRAIMGEGGVAGYSRMYLTPADVNVIIANGEKMRKKQKRTMMMIAGGIAIVVAAGVAVGIMLYRKNRKKSLDEEIQESLDVVDIDLEGEGTESPELDDAPHVDLDE